MYWISNPNAPIGHVPFFLVPLFEFKNMKSRFCVLRWVKDFSSQMASLGLHNELKRAIWPSLAARSFTFKMVFNND